MATTVFLLAAWIAASWLIRLEQQGPAFLLIGAYVVATLPIILVQLAVIADLLFALIAGSGVAIAAIIKLTDGVKTGWPLRALAGVLTTVSPFSSLSAWAWSVLLPSLSAGELFRAKNRAETAMLVLTWRRLKKSVSR
jgi:hypothetical protein